MNGASPLVVDDDGGRALRVEGGKGRPQKCAQQPASVLGLEAGVVHVVLWLGWGRSGDEARRSEAVSASGAGGSLDDACSPFACCLPSHEKEALAQTRSPYIHSPCGV